MTIEEYYKLDRGDIIMGEDGWKCIVIAIRAKWVEIFPAGGGFTGGSMAFSPSPGELSNWNLYARASYEVIK